MTDIEELMTRIRRERRDAEMELRQTDADGRHRWEPPYGFTSNDRVLLAAAVEAVRRKICAYGGPERCDCKYGMGIEVLGGARPSGEATGCPELRSVVLELLHPAPDDTKRSAWPQRDATDVLLDKVLADDTEVS